MQLQRAFQTILDALNHLKIPFMIGGSLASSVHGVFRSTNDIDIVADLQERHVAPFVARLGGAFYADPEAMTHVIHFESGYKFDIFPVGGNPYYRAQLERCLLQEVALSATESILCSVATAEDIILAKLAWYRAGGEQSERQWNDVRGIRSVQGDRLDQPYMREWADRLGVDDLLKKLLSEEEQH